CHEPRHPCRPVRRHGFHGRFAAQHAAHPAQLFQHGLPPGHRRYRAPRSYGRWSFMSAAATAPSSQRYGTDLSRLSPIAAKFASRDQLKWIIALVASLGAMLEVIDTSIVNVAMPE